MNRPRRSGQSLFEVLVVIAIIALLFTLILSGMQSLREMARRAQCLNNLNQIGVAYNNQRTTSTHFRGQTRWVQELLPFLEKKQSAFYCVNDSRPEYQYQPPAGSIYIQPARGFEVKGWRTIPLETNGARCRLSKAVAPTTKGSFGLEIEDWHDWDFNDLRMRCEPLPNGDMKITAISISAANRFDLRDEDGQTLVKLFNPGKWGVVPGGAARSSYGVNNYAKYFAYMEGSHKILAVEYKKVVANVLGPAATDIFTKQAAPRHRGLANVLFLDGHVLTMNIDSINPNVARLAQEYWMPSKKQ